MLLELLVMLVKFSKLIRQDVGIGNEIKVLLAIAFLHPHNVEAKSIFPCDFMTLGEVIDFLVLIQAFVEV